MKLPHRSDGHGRQELDSLATSYLVDKGLRVRCPFGIGRLCGFVANSATLTSAERAGGRSSGPWLQVELNGEPGNARPAAWVWAPARHVVRYRQRDLSRG